MVHQVNVVLDLSVPAGGRVRTTWRPAAGAPLGWIWVQHGFSRSARHMAGVAELLSARGYVTVAPDIATLRPWRSMHDVTWLTSVATTIARAIEVGLLDSRGIPTAGPMIGVGHSAGAAIVAHAAMVLGSIHRGDRSDANVQDGSHAARGAPSGDGQAQRARVAAPIDVAGLALLDPVDSIGQLFARALPSLDAVPIDSLTCRPSRCNRQGILGAELARSGRPVAAHPDLNHGDPERIPAQLHANVVPAPSRAIAAVCGPPGSPGEVVALGEGLLTSVERCRSGA